MSKPPPIKERIAAAMANGERDYYVVLEAVFPPALYPKAWRNSSNGGPPGCAMAFGRALRELGLMDFRRTRNDKRQIIHRAKSAHTKGP
jgi:hypothetical protein